MAELPTPIWVLESYTYEDSKIARLIVELPNDPILNMLDTRGEFNPAVFNQVMQILQVLKGEIPSGTLMETGILDRVPIIEHDCDFSLIMFIKHYRGSSMTAVCKHRSVSTELITKMNDSSFTNPLFKEAPFIMKVPMGYVQLDGMIFFTITGHETSDLDESEVSVVRSKI